MMDVAQLFKRDHARATDLFEKLSDTSDQAVKTRERLFAQLKMELDAHRQVVEDQLYPILKKHKETKDLVPTVKERNEVEKRLAELEQMPKEDEGFLKKVGELKKTVEQHLRDEERRMVPAIKKALEGDEIKELAATLTEEKREQLQEAKQRAEEARSNGPDQLRAGEISGETVQKTAEPIQVLTGASKAAVTGVNELRQVWVGWVNSALQTNARAAHQLFQCRNLGDLAEVQRNFAEESMSCWLESSSRMLQLTRRMVGDAVHPIEEQRARTRHQNGRGA